MRSKKFNEVRPYTYWIKHKETGIKYVGLRYYNIKFNRTPLQDFGIRYFTTGKLKKEFKANPNNFNTKLLFTYDSVKEAIDHELELTAKAKDNNRYANLASYPHIPATPEVRRKISEGNKGKKYSNEVRKRLSELAKKRRGKKRGTYYICTFEEAKNYAQKLKIKSKKEWFEFTKTNKFNDEIPKTVSTVFSSEWKGWGDFFGTGLKKGQTYEHLYKKQKEEIKSYEEVKKYALSLKLKNMREWIAYTKSKYFPYNISKNPQYTYKKEFEGWGIFLGTGTTAQKLIKYRSFEDAKKYVKNLKIEGSNNRNGWIDLIAISKDFPKDLPRTPEHVYKKQWKGWDDFLGKKKKS